MSNNLSPDEYIHQIRKKQGYMPFQNHLETLRWHILRSLAYTVFFAIIVYSFFDISWDFVMNPILSLIQEAKVQNIPIKLISTQMFHNFFIRIKVSFLIALVFSIPFILWELWRFLLPAVQRKSRIAIYTVLFFSVLLFWSGIIFSRFWIWPLLNNFLIYEWLLPESTINATIIRPEIHLTINDYLSFFFSFHFSCGLIFQMPIVSILLAFLDILNWKFFLQFWKEGTIIIIIASAIITPPDMLSMLLLSIPMFILYILSAFATYLINIIKRTPK